MRLFFFFLGSLFFLSLFLFKNITFADSKNYKTSYKVIYEIKDNGQTHTTMNIALTNLTSKYYSTSYKLHIGFADIKNIKASDKGGSITPILKKMEEGYSVELVFNEKVVGIGNTMNFTLSFDISSVAKNRDGLWEISIPSISDQENFSDFVVEVKPPKTFGKPSVIRPKTKNDSLIFQKNELGKSGISILFGDKQQYSYSLLYHLKNNNVFPIQTEIALPPSTNYQESILQSIEPKPTNITLDKDGNWLAHYSLSPSERKDVKVKGIVKLFLTPKQVELTNEERKEYTSEKPYWEFSDEIKAQAKKLKSAQEIYDFTVKKLTYDYKKRTTTSNTRVGASNVLKNPTSAVCLEFTDLFITLARASGIPSREVDGFAHTDNKADRPLSLIPDVLHAWPEYYDDSKKTWIMVDPTWGNTTGGLDYFNILDLDHITFVRRGMDSKYPIPAGGYKLNENDLQKDVSVAFDNELINPKQNLTLVSVFDDEMLSGFVINGQLKIANLSSIVTDKMILIIESKTLKPNRQKINVNPIPPYGTSNVNISFSKTPFLTKGEHNFTIVLADKKITDSIRVSPFFITKWHILGGIIIAVFSITIFIITYKTGRLPFFRR